MEDLGFSKVRGLFWGALLGILMCVQGGRDLIFGPPHVLIRICFDKLTPKASITWLIPGLRIRVLSLGFGV